MKNKQNCFVLVATGGYHQRAHTMGVFEFLEDAEDMQGQAEQSEVDNYGHQLSDFEIQIATFYNRV